MASTSPSYAYQYKKGSTFAFTDLLVWRVREGGSENWAQYIGPKGTSQTINLYEAPFNWNTGFRVGLGYNSPDELWDSVLYWTSYQTKSTNTASGNIYSSYVGNFFANNTNGVNFGPYYRNASIQWRFFYNTVDVELGRNFKIDNVLTLHPFVGIKTAIINQNIDTNWQTPFTTFLDIPIPITSFSSATESLKNDFSGVGPSIGLNTTWPLFKGQKNSFNLIGNFSGALLWGHWSFNELYQNNTPYSATVNVSSVNGASPMARALMGLEWASQFSKVDLNVRLGYEAQVWFNQVQFYSLNMGRLNGLMSLQGGVLDFTFKF